MSEHPGDDGDQREPWQMTFFGDFSEWPAPDPASIVHGQDFSGWAPPAWTPNDAPSTQWAPAGWPPPDWSSGNPADRLRRSRRLRRLTAAGLAVVTLIGVGGWAIAADSNVAESSGLPSVQHLTSASTGSSATTASFVERSVFDIVAEDGESGEEDAGTGTVLTSNGEILTNNHVVDGATRIEATSVTTGRTYQATVVGTDATDDVAVIQLRDASGLTPITAGDSAAVRSGTAVIAIGNAGGRGTPTVATGTITATNRNITASDGEGSSEQLHGLLQTNADIVSGDSGGPLVDSAGQVIGMDTAAATPDSGSPFGATQGNITSSTDGYAIPIERALSIAQQIVQGKASSTVVIGTPGLLGVQVSDSSSSSEYGYPEGSETESNTPGADVVGVVNSDPAGEAGVVSGDVITGLNGKSISSATALTQAMRSTHAGESVQLTWVDTDGASHTASITLLAGPAA